MMMGRVLSVFASALFFTALASAHAADTQAGKIADGDWAVQLKPAAGNKVKGTTQAYEDILTIKDGKFSTQVNTKYGFTPVAYTVKTDGGKTILTAELNDDKHGKSVYELEVKAGKVAGKMSWGKMGDAGKPISADYTVAGELKK